MKFVKMKLLVPSYWFSLSVNLCILNCVNILLKWHENQRHNVAKNTTQENHENDNLRIKWWHDVGKQFLV